MEKYPRTLAEFEACFSTEEDCRDYLVRLRWPEGFRCPRCGESKGWPQRTVLLQCAGCGYQSSVTAGTVFQDTHQPLTLWFRAMWHVTSQKNGASALGLPRVLGLGSYRTAWTWLQKLRRAMVRPGRDRLSGWVEVDETYLGAVEEGAAGRGSESKALVVVAAQADGKGIGRIRMRPIPDASAESLHSFVEKCIEPGSTVHTDGWQGVRRAQQERLPTRGDGAPGTPEGREQAVAACPSGRVAAEAVVDGHSPGCCESWASGLLPGRVHVPFQPSEVEKPGEAVLPVGPAGRGN